MDLISKESDLVGNKRNKIILWNFLKYAHISFLFMLPELLNIVLNEYLLYMHFNFNLYPGRFNNNGVVYNFDKYSILHLSNFVKVIHEDELPEEEIISNEDYDEMVNFYNELLDYVKNITGKKFMYGTKFNKSDKKKLTKYYCEDEWLDMADSCIQKKLQISVPKSYFDLDKYKKINKLENVKYEYRAVDIVLKINNKSSIFSCLDLWDIRDCISIPTYYFVEWESVNVKIAYIFFTYDHRFHEPV
ncbi:hypothetical protein H012_gp532 [Acanthamoeba polyphaga moumouvirus]|uniref:Uncharacterized protein n=1 Tax=Acanthamoeba polyphaga moumouvirus TaxID=1269028 RepID=L7RCZ0_9VIRU|nr:hypothetical protein H012_gp532 [Acanthamoeba polyphaga moumouvirus]AGC01928.1 hypothetical protein Moumou_00392 [Acanthamoeba polyphaga moumouvirus]AQN68290.1 hypothetical protein [Saudi moumouvirus]